MTNELEKLFRQSWNEFETAVFHNAVFQKIQHPLECQDAVLIIKNSGLFHLDAKQVTLLEHLRDVHEIITKKGAQSASITSEDVDTLKQITTLINA